MGKLTIVYPAAQTAAKSVPPPPHVHESPQEPASQQPLPYMHVHGAPQEPASQQAIPQGNTYDEEPPHVHDAHPHEGDGASSLGIGAANALEFFNWWAQLTSEIAARNAQKAAMVKKLRASYGPYHVEALKRACNLALKDGGKVAKDDALNKVALGYLGILQNLQ